jgi:hypothetical protein
MISSGQPIGELQKCVLCDQEMNPTEKIFNTHTRLCSTCFYRMEKQPEIVTNSIERFLIGNVVSKIRKIRIQQSEAAVEPPVPF